MIPKLYKGNHTPCIFSKLIILLTFLCSCFIVERFSLMSSYGCRVKFKTDKTLRQDDKNKFTNIFLFFMNLPWP